MPQVRDPKTGRYISGGGSSVGGAASTNPRIQKAAAVGNGAPAGGSSKSSPKSSSKSVESQVEKIVEGGSYSSLTVAKQLGIPEKEALEHIKKARKAVGIRKGTPLGMESGETRKLNPANLENYELKNSVREAAAGTTIKTKSTTYTKNDGPNWTMKSNGSNTRYQISDPVTHNNIGTGDIVEFTFIKK